MLQKTKDGTTGGDGTRIDPGALHRFSYGLFLLSTRMDGRDNGCIINTGIQITDNPKRILVAVNKANYSCELVQATGVFNLSVLTEETPFAIFQSFGFRSGRDVDKLAGLTLPRTENGLVYLTGCANAVLSGKVRSMEDCGSHMVFIADLTEALTISTVPSATYAYYFAHIKPKPQPVPERKTGWICKICGYVREDEELPPDFICPTCKHGAADFQKIR